MFEERRARKAGEAKSNTDLERYARDTSVEVRRAVARNHSTPEHVLWLLSTDPDFHTRIYVAAHSNASRRCFEVLARGSTTEPHYVAANPACPPDILHLLATTDQQKRARSVPAVEGLWYKALAGQVPKVEPGTVLSVAAMLYHDAPISEAVAQNPSTLPSTLAILAQDHSHKVRDCEVESLNEIRRHRQAGLRQLAQRTSATFPLPCAARVRAACSSPWAAWHRSRVQRSAASQSRYSSVASSRRFHRTSWSRGLAWMTAAARRRHRG